MFRVLSLVLLVGVLAKSLPKRRILVIVENEDIQKSHQRFFNDLEKNGFTLVFKNVDDKSVILERWGEFAYDHLILFAPSAKSFGKKIQTKEVLDFIDSGRNVLMVGSSNLSKRVFDIGMECGVDFEAPESRVIDHVHFAKVEDSTTNDHDLIVVEPEERIQTLFNQRKTTANRNPLLFKGIGHSVAPNQEYVTVALTAHPTSYSFDPAHPIPEDAALLAGKDLTLISLLQTTNNARVSIIGSLEFFSDDFFTKRFVPIRQHLQTEWMTSGNQGFALDLALWTFQTIGVLDASPPRHFHSETGYTPSIYTIRDPIHFEMEIMEYNGDHWMPYRSNDIQIEYIMLDPHIRTHLKDTGNGTFFVDLRAPDVYGVFKFVIQYHRPGYSNIDITVMAPIRPLRHDKYERFLPAAYPYYASLFSLMAGFWIFGILYLYHK